MPRAAGNADAAGASDAAEATEGFQENINIGEMMESLSNA
jgi:hypothetical protein